jgi:hypothetical protein
MVAPIMRAPLVGVVIPGLFAVLLALGAPVAAAAPLSPLVVDWERYFTIDSRATRMDGRSLVTGMVRNTSSCGAQRIQLLIDALDSSGQLVDQRVEWLGTDLTPGSHVYFEIAVASPAAGYRVSVFAFEIKKRC